MSFWETETWPGAIRKAIVVSGLALLGCIALPDSAKADFRVCNGTATLVGVAIGYRDAEGWISEGWWRIPPSACRSVVEGDLKSRFYYLYAEDDQGRSRWAGSVPMCIAENEFRVAGVKDCFTRGFQEIGFREYDTGEQGSWMVQLTETPSGSN